MSLRRLLPVFVLAASATALASAYLAQYGFGLRPCVLCLTQRVPFAIAGGLALAALLWPRRWRALMALAGLAFLVNGGIAFYHFGVEQKWWLASCASGAPAKVSLSDLAAQMSRPPEMPRCDEPAWEWHGVTMAGLNVFYSGGLAVLVLAALRRRKHP